MTKAAYAQGQTDHAARNEIKIIRALPGYTYPIAEQLGMSVTTVHNALKRLLDADVVIRTTKKTWKLTVL